MTAAELSVIGRSHAVSYAPESGKELWRMGGLTGQSTPTPLAADGLLYLATGSQGESNRPVFAVRPGATGNITLAKDRKSTRLNSSHLVISYAVFCLKKK